MALNQDINGGLMMNNTNGFLTSGQKLKVVKEYL